LKTFGASTYITHHACWIAKPEGEIGYVFGYNRSSANEGITPNRVAGHDGGIGTDSRPLADCRLVETLVPNLAAGINIVRKHGVRTDKYLVLNCDPIPERNAIFDCHAITNADILLDKTMVTDVNVRTDRCTLLDIAESPDSSTLPD
jgi:hypothetical protein